MTSYIGYIFFRVIAAVFKILPFKLVYGFSNLVGFLLHRVFKYRENVIDTNLKIAGFNTDKRQNIKKIYYQYMADLAMESIKACTMSKDSFDKRFEVKNLSLVQDYFDRGQNIMIVTAHIGNWEWAATLIGGFVPHVSLGVYKPLSNKHLNSYIYKTRSRFGTELINMKEVRESIDREHDDPYALILVADQNPSNAKKSIWVPIFDVETPFAHGMEEISKNRNLPIVYGDIKKNERGSYVLSFSTLIESPAQEKEKAITTKFANHIEQIIKTRPADWLWSHKRWKRLKPYVY